MLCIPLCGRHFLGAVSKPDMKKIMHLLLSIRIVYFHCPVGRSFVICSSSTAVVGPVLEVILWFVVIVLNFTN